MNKNKDLKLIKMHWEDPKTVSLKDRNLQEIERHYITESLKKIGGIEALADIGCGDGVDTAYWCDFAKDVTGYDYSASMIKKARKNLRGKANLFQIDLLKDKLPHLFNVVITKRCLINLGNFENQKKVLLKINKSMKKKGHYVMLE
jgi:predicted TPR repeat methyltransferase